MLPAFVATLRTCTEAWLGLVTGIAVLSQVLAHTEADIQETLQPISRILSEVGDDERALFVLREWRGVSAAPAA